jgi:hypothetical protein
MKVCGPCIETRAKIYILKDRTQYSISSRSLHPLTTKIYGKVLQIRLLVNHRFFFKTKKFLAFQDKNKVVFLNL